MGEQAHIKVDQGEFSTARQNLEEALHLSIDPVDQGQIYYWTGYCEYKLGQREQASRYLRLARDQLKTQHPLDADAAYLLGKIAQEEFFYHMG